MATDTSTYKMNHSMIRVKDPKRSLEFYQNALGMKLIHTLKRPQGKFDLYFLAFDGPNAKDAGKHWTDRQGVLELNHNYGTEDDPNYKVVTGNEDPYKGFGHIAISVDNIQAACKRLEDLGVPFQKKLTDGRMKHIAFAKDPDGYWVELISLKNPDKTENETGTDPSGYRFNHTMIRVKDPKVSLDFYQNILGMKLKRTSEQPAAKFNLYFLGYGEDADPNAEEGVNPLADHEGLVELTWNYGTENDKDFKYHSGNEEPQGFGHLCITVDNIEAACDKFESHNLKWQKKLRDGRIKHVAFLKDPDEYWIEIGSNETLKKTEG